MSTKNNSILASLIFYTLPHDNFGVYVGNDMDKRKLLWLVNQIGEKKLRISSGKYKNKYPESDIFVSTVLKWHGLKVPAEVFTEVNVPIYRVYILCLQDQSALKLGFTGGWPGRAFDFVKTADYNADYSKKIFELFDTDKSIAFEANSESLARQIEHSAKLKFAEFKVPSPYERGLISYGNRTSTEWFQYSIYDNLIQYLSSFKTSELNASRSALPLTLRNAINFGVQLNKISEAVPN